MEYEKKIFLLICVEINVYSWCYLSFDVYSFKFCSAFCQFITDFCSHVLPDEFTVAHDVIFMNKTEQKCRRIFFFVFAYSSIWVRGEHSVKVEGENRQKTKVSDSEKMK